MTVWIASNPLIRKVSDEILGEGHRVINLRYQAAGLWTGDRYGSPLVAHRRIST